MAVKSPFSRRNSGSQWIQDDFPSSARIALIYLLHDLVDKKYVESWIDIDREARRIAREEPIVYNREKVSTYEDARTSVESIIKVLSWGKIFDFCERLHTHIATEVTEWDSFGNVSELVTSRENVQQYISDELQRIFLEENLAFTFSKGEVERRGRSHTRKQIAKAEPTLGDPRLNDARTHYKKALAYFENPQKPDFENSVKEAVCAVEAAAIKLFPKIKGKTLGEIINNIKGNQEGQLPTPLANTLIGIYGFRNAGEGVSHGGTKGGKVNHYLAEYVLSAAASQIILLHEISSIDDTNVPF